MSITRKDLLQELLNETQAEMSTYCHLPERKKKRKKLMLAYRYLVYRESMLKEELGKNGTTPL